MVEQYLAFAESQALQHKPMYMKDWIDRLKMILVMNERNILDHTGKITHELAMKKASSEYEKYKAQIKLEEKEQSLKELDEGLKRVRRTTKGKQ